MLNITTDTSFDDLKIFLEKLFQFENDDLDFGIYKILNYKKSEIQTFINNLLTEKVKEELNLLAGVESENLSVQLKELETDDVIIGYNKALTEKDETTINVLTSVSKTKIDQYKSLKKQAIHNQQTEKAEGHIYKHLALFFSRYYDKGDFISKRRYGKTEKYIIPYNGEETYFYWANADQYYIKSSEFFRKYSFRIPATDGYTIVNFKLKDANEEQGNTRSEENKYFIVADAPVEITDAEINIFFEYRAITDAEKTQKGNNQSKLNEHALPVIKKALGADTAIVSLFTETEGKTKLGNELNRYTSRNKYDFFIHKDLKGFLTRELDFYIKSELLKLDDLTVFDSETHFETIKLQFTIIKAFKKIAAIIIDFISQIEDFQKKL
jgi:adenine-specific DNA-methyltransferase